MPKKKKTKVNSYEELPIEPPPEKTLLLEDSSYFVVVCESPDGIMTLFDINSNLDSIHGKITASNESKAGYRFHVFQSKKIGELVALSNNIVKVSFPVFNSAAYSGSVN